MKRQIFIFLSVLGIPLSLTAQNVTYRQMMQDAPEKMYIVPACVEGSAMSYETQDLVMSRLSSGIENAGEMVANQDHSDYLLTFQAIELDKAVASTVPPMIITRFQFTMKIMDEGRVYATHSINLKGSGETETASYANAVKNISFRNEAFVRFITSAKQNVIDFYNQDIDNIIAEAKKLHKNGKADEAVGLLSQVPKFASEAWSKANKTAASISRAKTTGGGGKGPEIVDPGPMLPPPPPIPHLPSLPALKLS